MRAEGGRGSGKGGEGMGSAMVYGCVDEQVGIVGAANDPDGGAAFQVRFTACG